MIDDLGTRLNLSQTLGEGLRFFQQPIRLVRSYDRNLLRADAIAGVTVAVVLLPQAIAFALIAELPPQAGLYTAIVAAIAGALWGSSFHLHSGPTNSSSLIVLSTLSTVAIPGSPEFIILAGTVAAMVGLFKIAVGIAHLGILVNFVSHSVIVGFTAGAGVLIAIGQLRSLFGLEFESHGVLETLFGVMSHVTQTHQLSLVLGVGVMVFIVVLRRFAPKLPGPLLGIVLSAAVVAVFSLDEQGVAVIQSFPRELPPLRIPHFDLNLVGQLSIGALAISAIGLVEAVSIARLLANQTGQRLDINQEFVGQGLASLLSGVFSGYPPSGSFSRSAVNLEAGAQTPFAAVFSGVFVLIAMLALAPLAAFIPRTAIAAVLIVIAYGMVDRSEIRRIWHGTKGDTAIMAVTFFATLFLEIEFAVLSGILASFARYIMRTSTPSVYEVMPDADYKHFNYQPDRSPCPQLGVVNILGDLYFGAVNHVEEAILKLASRHPEQRFLLLRMHNVNHCDFSGIHMLESVVRTYRDRGGDVFMVRVGSPVMRLMDSTGFTERLSGHFLADEAAISHLFYRVLDPAVCIYECPVRAFKECQNLPKRSADLSIPLHGDVTQADLQFIEARALWDGICTPDATSRPTILDVREPREFHRGHIQGAELMPLPTILSEQSTMPTNRPIVLVCRSGRRSRRAAVALQQHGVDDVRILSGGMLAWEAAGLLVAVE